MFRYLELISSARVVGACIDKKTKQKKQNREYVEDLKACTQSKITFTL